jgi:MATE family multidrug resistance protein
MGAAPVAGAPGHRRVLAIALPIVLSNATVPLLGIVNTAVVGQMGLAAPIGAVGLGAVVLASIYWVFGFLRMGTSGLVAQARGAGDEVGQRHGGRRIDAGLQTQLPGMRGEHTQFAEG